MYIRKDKHALSTLLHLASLTDPAWKRGSTFDHLATVMKDHIDGHSIADLVSAVSTEMPISTKSSLMEANTAGEQIKNAAFQIENLYGGEMYFLTSGGKKVKGFKSAKPEDRPEDIAHFVFHGHIDANGIDARIK